MFNNHSLQQPVESYLLQSRVPLPLSVCGSQQFLSSWGMTNLTHTVSYLATLILFCFQPSSQLKGRVVLRRRKGFLVLCLPDLSELLLQPFMLKSKTRCKMSSPFLPLLKLVLISVLATLSKLFPFSFPVRPAYFLLLTFLCVICSSVHSRVHLSICLWAQEVEYFTFSLASSSFISFFTHRIPNGC